MISNKCCCSLYNNSEFNRSKDKSLKTEKFKQARTEEIQGFRDYKTFEILQCECSKMQTSKEFKGFKPERTEIFAHYSIQKIKLRS